MSTVLKLIDSLCPNGVPYSLLKNVCTVKKGVQLNKNQLKEEGMYPVINGGINPSGYWDEYNFDANLITISQGGASAGFVNYLETPFWAGAHCYVVVSCSENIVYRYLYHFIKQHQKTFMNSQYGAGIPSLSLKTIHELSIPVPPLEVQCEIVRVLDSFTLLTAELTAELTARRKQYNYYHRMLLDMDESVPRMKLSDVCDLSSGGDVPKDRFSENKTDEYATPIYSNGLDKDGLYGYTDVPRITKPAVTIAGRGAGVGNAILRHEPYYPIIRLVSAVPKEFIEVEYLYHCIKAIEFKIPQGGIPQLTVPMVSAYEIPVPDITIQRDMAKKLNSFETLLNDMSSGIPAEINARQKQYEYYRDVLLNMRKEDDT